ncbi:MAG TPA: SOS response-associated peptidase [bacterium]|nr:SOS response-associated peptidase [bacterium]
MCSRFALKSPPKTIAQLLGVEESLAWDPRYNVAPSQAIPTAVHPLDGKKREMRMMHWGFTATWHQGGRLVVNLRSEDLQEKPLFQESFEKWRCLIPVDGFYEWRHEARETRPFFIRLKSGRPFALAGLWAPQPSLGQTVDSCAILTTSPNETVKAIHERMPVIVEGSDFGSWLDSKDIRDFDKIRELFKPYPADRMEAFEVDHWVNDPRHDGPRCLEPFQNPGTLPLPF